MDQDKFIALLYKQLQGGINLVEKTLLNKWLDEAAINRVLAQKIKEDWELSEQYSPNIEIEVDVDKEFTLLQQRIEKEENLGIVKGKIVPVKRRTQWWAYAAAVTLLVGLGTWLFINQSITTQQLIVTTDIKEQKEIQLADGTKVWINAKSSFTYPEHFDGTSRQVYLKGEAFFDVHEDATRPFIIQTANSSIEVLGTSFNVQALPSNTYTEVVVQTGKVRLSSLETAESVDLVANEKGIHQHQNNQVKKVQETDMNELSWKSRVLFYKNTPVPEVIESLERFFKVVIVAPANSQDCLFTGRFKEPDLKTIIKAISEEFNIRVKRKNASYQLEGGCLVE